MELQRGVCVHVCVCVCVCVLSLKQQGDSDVMDNGAIKVTSMLLHADGGPGVVAGACTSSGHGKQQGELAHWVLRGPVQQWGLCMVGLHWNLWAVCSLYNGETQQEWACMHACMIGGWVRWCM